MRSFMAGRRPAFLLLSRKLDEVIAELGFDGVGNLPFLHREAGFLEGLDHHSLAEPAEVATAFAGGAFAVGGRQLFKLGAGIDLLLEAFCFGFALDKDVAGFHLGHGERLCGGVEFGRAPISKRTRARRKRKGAGK